MSRLSSPTSNTVGQKIFIACTGLLLCGFLVMHLAGNLLLLAGPEAYNEYTHKLHSYEPLVKVAEVVLFLLFASHIVLAVRLSIRNRRARGSAYAMSVSKRDDRILGVRLDYWMLPTGLLVLAFLLLHLVDFTWELRPDVDYAKLEPYDKALVLLRSWPTIIGYSVGTILLGAHLLHGAPSLCQTLGLNHRRYNKCIKFLGGLFAIVIALGFFGLVLWANWFEHGGGHG